MDIRQDKARSFICNRYGIEQHKTDHHDYKEKLVEGKPKVSIVGVLWNNLKLNKLFLESIKKHTQDYELILVDNNSNDGTEEWLKEVFETWNEPASLKIVELHNNNGWPHGVNAGVSYAEGEHICWLNNDLEVTDGWLKKMLTHLDFAPDVGAVGPTSNFVMGLQKVELNQNFRQGNHHEVNFLIGFCMLIKGEAFGKVGLIDEDFWDVKAGSGSADDIDYSMRLTQAGYKLIIARSTFIHHHGSKSFELIFGKDIYKAGTPDHTKYMADVEKFLKHLREKWGHEAVEKTMAIPPIPSPFVGTIGIPHGDFIPSDSFHSLISLNIPNNVQLLMSYGSGVSKARNNIVEGIQGDWLAFIDSDMTFPSDALAKLLEHLKNPEVDIVTAICYRKVPNYEPCIFKKLPGNNPHYRYIGDWPKDRIFEIDACGSAFIVVKRHVYEAMTAPHYSYSDFLSEDLNFCRKAKDYGFRIWADPTINIGHVKGLPIGEEVYRSNPANATMITDAPRAWPELWNFGIKKAPSENAQELGRLGRAEPKIINDFE